MPTLGDIMADLPRPATLQAVRGLTAEEAATLAEELATYNVAQKNE